MSHHVHCSAHSAPINPILEGHTEAMHWPCKHEEPQGRAEATLGHLPLLQLRWLEEEQVPDLSGAC